VRISRLFVASGCGVLGVLAGVQACNALLAVNGGNDGSMNADSNNPQPDGSMMMDTGGMDAGMDVAPPYVVGLAVGGHHACALIVDGTIRCWGRNDFGQLGSGGNDAGMLLDGAPRTIPIQVDNITNATEVAATTVYDWGSGSTCARLKNAGVLCFGNNSAAQLGLKAIIDADAEAGPVMGVADQVPHPWPTQLGALGSSTSVGLGNSMGCATTAQNEYWCWGDNGPGFPLPPGILGHGPLPMGATPPEKASLLADASISVGSPGSVFNLALRSDGTVLSWGNNMGGSLGRTANDWYDPTPAPVANVSNAVQIAAGEWHACAVTQGGDVLCWGGNGSGELGRGFVGGSSNTAQAVSLPMGKKAAQVACSNCHTCVTATDGSVFCWGCNNAGQVGPSTLNDGGFNPQPSPSPVAVNLPVKALAVGTGGTYFHMPPKQGMGNDFISGYSCALLEGGAVSCWGINIDSVLGRGTSDAGLMICGTVNGWPYQISCSPTPSPVVWQ